MGIEDLNSSVLDDAECQLKGSLEADFLEVRNRAAAPAPCAGCVQIWGRASDGTLHIQDQNGTDANLSAALYTAPVGQTLCVDGSRTDPYVADGSPTYPFQTLEAALAVANAAATAAHPYLVTVAPGVYAGVAPSTIGSYVRVVGAGWSQTILQCADLAQHFLTLAPAASIRDVGIYGPTAAFRAALYLPTTDPRAVAITEVQIHRGAYGVLAQPAGGAALILRNLTYGYKVGHTVGTLVRLEGGVTAVLNAVTATGPDEALQVGVSAVGAAVTCTLTGLYHTCFGAATVGVVVDGGATLRLLSSVFAGGHTAIRLGADGASRLRADGNLVHRALGVPSNYTYDIDIQGAAASVVYSSGFVSRDKIRNLAGATEIYGQFVNHEATHEGGCVIGEFYIGDHADTPFPLLRYTKDVGVTGLVSGGAVTRGAGRQLLVAAGAGYVNDGTHPVRVTWAPAAVTLGANQQREYVYVTAAGLVTHAALKPDYNTNIILARAVTGAATVDLLTQDEVGVAHVVARQADYLEHTVGPLVESGCATLLGGSGGRHLRVASGVFWVGLSERAVTGADDLTFTAWYRSGSNWVAVPGQTEVDVTQWDDGSGALAALTGGKYTNATLYVATNADGDEYHMVYGQAEFNSQGDAEAGALPVPPNVLKEYCCRSAAVVVLQGAAAIASFVDVRPQVGQFAAAGSGVAGDHDLLINLANDAHLQYLTTGRAATWHGGLAGAHVTNGDAHDHSGGDGAQVDHATLANRGTTAHADIDSHIASTSNPHGVTAAQVAAIPAAEKAAALGVASLDAASKVVQDPASATATPTAGKIVIADGAGKVDGWVSSGAAAATPALRAIGTGALEACAGNDARLPPAAPTATPTAGRVPLADGAGKLDGWVSSGAAAATPALRAIGTAALEACAGNDARLSDPRVPTAHQASHVSGADQIDDATAAVHGLMTAAQVVKLAGIAAGATLNVFGNDAQQAVAEARVTNATGVFAAAATLTTPALTGTYRVTWEAVVDQGATNQNVEVQLFNVTDAAVVGTPQVLRPTNVAERMPVGGTRLVTFTGAPKTFAVQYRGTGNTAGCAGTRIEVYRWS